MSKLVLTALLSFICGIALQPFIQFLNPSQSSWLTYWILLSPCALLFLCLRNLPKSIRIIPLFLLLGMARMASGIHFATPENIDFYNEAGFTEITGTICEEPDRRIDKQKLSVCTETIGKDEKSISGKILINTERYPEYEYGDQLRIYGAPETPGEFDSFSYKNYLERYNVYSIIYRARVEKTGEKSFNPVFKILFYVKKRFEEKLNEVFPEPFGSFMAGLITGSRKGIPEKLTEQFAITGLSHIVAISGYNITILVTIVMALLKNFGKRFAIITSALTVILFTIAVGASAAVVRACIMGLISLLALNYGRKGNITITLLATVTIMLLINPKILYFDVGFQLSFMATVGLIYMSPIFEKYTKFFPNLLGLKEGLLLTTAAQITTLPIILMNFERLSMVAPIANMLISGPFIPFAMLFGFLGGLTAFASVVLGKFIGFAGYICLKYITAIVEMSAGIPYAAIDIFWFNNTLLVLYYVILGSGLFLYWRRKNNQEICSQPSNQQSEI